MSDKDALLAAIIAAPDDDTPRLVYADWLDEHDQPERAEFIRVQCRMARAKSPDTRDKTRANELEFAQLWALLGDATFKGHALWQCRRGFPERVRMHMGGMIEHYEQFARLPWIQELVLDYVDDDQLIHFVRQFWNPRWTHLELVGNLDPAHRLDDYGTWSVIELARSPQSRQLRTLRLLSLLCPHQEVINALAESPFLTELQTLEIPSVSKHLDPTALRKRFGARLVEKSAR